MSSWRQTTAQVDEGTIEYLVYASEGHTEKEERGGGICNYISRQKRRQMMVSGADEEKER